MKGPASVVGLERTPSVAPCGPQEGGGPLKTGVRRGWRAGAGGRVGPPPGPEKRRRSVWRGRRGPTSHGARNRNGVQTQFFGPPSHPACPRRPMPIPRESPFPGPPPELVPSPRSPAGPEKRPVSCVSGSPESGPFRPPPPEPGMSLGAAPGGVGKPTTGSSVVLPAEMGDGAIQKMVPGRNP